MPPDDEKPNTPETPTQASEDAKVLEFGYQPLGPNGPKFVPDPNLHEPQGRIAHWFINRKIGRLIRALDEHERQKNIVPFKPKQPPD